MARKVATPVKHVGRGQAGVNKRIKRNKVPIKSISDAAIKRLARRGGVQRLSAQVYDPIRIFAQNFINKLVRDAMILCASIKRKTIQPMDIIQVLKIRGKTVYGLPESY